MQGGTSAGRNAAVPPHSVRTIAGGASVHATVCSCANGCIRGRGSAGDEPPPSKKVFPDACINAGALG